MIRSLLLIFIILAIPYSIGTFIFYKYTKYGRAKWNKMKHEEQEFLDKWGDK